MSDVSLHQFLVLYTWFPLAALLLFFLLIARFYQKFSGDRTFYWLYILVMVLFGMLAVRSAGIGIVVGDNLMSIISVVAGSLLVILSVRLYHLMMTNQDQ